MNSAASATTALPSSPRPARPHLDHKPGPVTAVIFVGLLAVGLLFTGYSLVTDVTEAGAKTTTWLPFILLGVALLIALGFEFVNGFHDTANAVATVIYTHSLPPNFAVVWSGFFNFLGVLVSSGAVAFGIISLLPVELILQVGSSAGFAMVFALLIAAIIWNLGTWWLGLPASSSHTLIGSIIGVGIANALMHGRDGTSGVDWAQATKVGYSLLLSPLVGFGCAALLLLALRALVKNRALYEEPKGKKAAAVVDPRHPDPHLHRCLVRARLQRRPEGHGPDHADSHRHGADGLRAEPRDAGEPGDPVRRGGAGDTAIAREEARRPRRRTIRARCCPSTCVRRSSSRKWCRRWPP